MRNRTETMRRVNTMLQVLQLPMISHRVPSQGRGIQGEVGVFSALQSTLQITKAQGHLRHTQKSTYFWLLQIIKLSSF